ncbi:hypothetical protein Pcinc_021636 [Petrolisthes cinctipes]|uniref:Uncharacterized protein n=1 Tax=Petrolisthes cinctipes TaxID=88211 RepID=A0AAE1FJL2_PETCI|nr:hypothetical protein Pcinc_021636 [Petrolisthes cinctipes]
MATSIEYCSCSDRHIFMINTECGVTPKHIHTKSPTQVESARGDSQSKRGVSNTVVSSISTTWLMVAVHESIKSSSLAAASSTNIISVTVTGYTRSTTEPLHPLAHNSLQPIPAQQLRQACSHQPIQNRAIIRNIVKVPHKSKTDDSSFEQ